MLVDEKLEEQSCLLAHIPIETLVNLKNELVMSLSLSGIVNSDTYFLISCDLEEIWDTSVDGLNLFHVVFGLRSGNVIWIGSLKKSLAHLAHELFVRARCVDCIGWLKYVLHGKKLVMSV